MRTSPLRAGCRLVLAITLGLPLATAAAFRPQDHGAVADGTAFDTTAVQRSIDAAVAGGGGTVLLTPGVYLCGTLTLRSGVTLHLEAGATILGSPRLADYRRGVWPALILASQAEDFAITGAGVIDGQGRLVAADTRSGTPPTGCRVTASVTTSRSPACASTARPTGTTTVSTS